MKNILLILLSFSAMLCFAQDKADDPKEEISKKEQSLKKQEKDLAKKMFALRVKLLKNDPELKKLYAKIMELHKELALQIDNKKEMRKLLKQIKTVRIKLAELKLQKEKEN